MALFWDIAEVVIDLVAPQYNARRRVRFTIHYAAFEGTNRPAYFLNITNMSRDRDIEITHVWIATDPPAHATPPERRLPVRLQPDESWETWIYADMLSLHDHTDPIQLGRARLSTGREVHAVLNEGVPHSGWPAGPRDDDE